MKLPFNQRTWSSIGVCALGLMLIVLAVLQYRWSRDVSEAAGARMRASLRSSVIRFREDFARELGNVAVAVQTDSNSVMGPEAATDYVQRIDNWKRSAPRPELLQSVYAFERRHNEFRLYRLNFQEARFEPTIWPASLEHLKDSLNTFSSDIVFFDQRVKRKIDERRQSPEPGQGRPDIVLHRNGPSHEFAGAPDDPRDPEAGPGARQRHEHVIAKSEDGELADRPPDILFRRDDRKPELGESSAAGHDGPRSSQDGHAAGERDRHMVRGFPRMPWLFDEAGAILIHVNVPPGPYDDRQSADAMGVLIELNKSVIVDEIFPQLALSHFAGTNGLEYDVAVEDRNQNNEILYASTPGFGTATKLSPDAEASLLGGFLSPETAIAGPVAAATGPVVTGSRIGAEQRFFGMAGPVRLERFRFQDRGHGWVLIAKHRKGSLEAALASMHRRQLAISFGVLALLAVTIAMIIVATRRAQNLAKLQMDFVTGVSHELRTPLAVIGSAAENIADGIIDDKTKLKRYGAAIRDQARHLTQLVEQILQFAATRQNGYNYNLSQVDPAEVVKLALKDSDELIRSAGFTVDQNIEDALPPVTVDVPAITHCLQNLITNAIKYSGESRLISLRAAKARIDGDDFEIQISVEDKGIGIAHADLRRIFDPFYRSPAVASAQIHGTGLGLALAKSIAEAMGGSLSVTSQLGKGSTFTLHLPCSKMQSVQPEPSENIYEPERLNR